MTTQVDEEVSLERQAIDQLKAYDDARKDETEAKKRKDKAAEPIRAYLDKNPTESVFDGEHGIEAKLQERKGRESYDVGAMPRELVLKLLKAGALLVDTEVLKVQKGTLPIDCQPFKVPGPVTYALDVKSRR